ncbi:putative transcriptional regulator [Allocatelliglobosispora scoriae]|uniref:Putative transcriptional regulator n=1 Tax=Allocatelliglobosispora scoriae TaxID=643052 RepID=A0A841BXM4_9ACTN|nr:Arc family DNA-binding protein [Allocatelliglobosispora scoriae]MBB5871431.1 putative transcriptional regulator [Allocatelliglobosispora scoriae]
MAVTFELPAKLHEAVKAIATAERRSLTQTLIIAVEDYVQRHQRTERIDELSARIAGEDAELLRRLG